MYKKIIKELENLAEPEFAEWLKPFLGIKRDLADTQPQPSPLREGDLIIGVRVPRLRKLAKLYKEINEEVLFQLLHSKIHEARALALFIMVIKSKQEPQKMCGIYLDNLEYINNWDLIDYTAPHIVAPYCEEAVLRELANSDYLWANRVAMVSTIYFIKKGDFKLALEFAEKFINHPHHLMHKASGWMLREIGKKDINVLKDFLNKHSTRMPAIMKNYAKEIFLKHKKLGV